MHTIGKAATISEDTLSVHAASLQAGYYLMHGSLPYAFIMLQRHCSVTGVTCYDQAMLSLTLL